MPHWIRVEDRGTQDQYDVDASAFDESIHKKVNAPAAWPDLTGEGDRPRPAVLKADVSAPTKKES